MPCVSRPLGSLSSRFLRGSSIKQVEAFMVLAEEGSHQGASGKPVLQTLTLYLDSPPGPYPLLRSEVAGWTTGGPLSRPELLLSALLAAASSSLVSVASAGSFLLLLKHF